MVNDDKQTTSQNNDHQLAETIDQKIDYLKMVNQALKDKNDLKMYQLLNSVNYNRFIRPEHKIDDYSKFTFLIDDIKPMISHYLSERLIKYLGTAYPFFYYNEYELGKFKIYFGNWWDHRVFGQLDALNVKFRFDEHELSSLKSSFELENQDKNVHSDQVLELSDQIQDFEELKATQSKRDAQKVVLHEQLRQNSNKSSMPWDAGKIKEEKANILKQINQVEAEDERASHASDSIERLKQKILELTKLDTILTYEKQSIRSSFGDFNKFIDVQNGLYKDYIKALIHHEVGDEND